MTKTLFPVKCLLQLLVFAVADSKVNVNVVFILLRICDSIGIFLYLKKEPIETIKSGYKEIMLHLYLLS